MNVYDFDGTIYNGDCTIDFYLWNLRKHPMLVRYLWRQLWGIWLYLWKKNNKRQLKSNFFVFLQGIDVEKEVADFWDYKAKNIERWYLEQKQKTDLIISASPEFLIKEICMRLQIQFPICTVVNTLTGQLEGENCRGKEKLNRFLNIYPQEKIDKFYSDSLLDQPLADRAQYAFRVCKGMVVRWNRREK